MKKSATRDIEKVYSKSELIRKLRRLANALETDKRFSIQIANEKINVPKNAIVNIEHERGKKEEEIKFQVRWEL